MKRILTIRSVPGHVVALTALASFGGQVLAVLQGWPLWAIALAMLLPWVPVFAFEMVWTYRHYQWLALFYVLVVTQGGHFIEHVVQMTQIHVLGLKGLDARGAFGALDIEWVHFTWNTWVIIAVLLLLYRFRANPWLWLTAIIAGWHEIEHIFIMSVYLATATAGTPGFLSKGGLIGGGLPLVRPDLHFFYNLIETTPLVIAFVYQLKRTYDEWLKRTFPHLSERVLTETTNLPRMMRFAAGQVIVRQGDAPDRFYIITKGEVGVTRRDQSGQEVELATLAAGQYFGEIGLLSQTPRTASIRAKTTVELLTLDREAFRNLVQTSAATAEALTEVARLRLSKVSEQGADSPIAF